MTVISWITAEVPDRTLGGGSVRQAHLLEAVASRWPTDLLLAGAAGDDPAIDRTRSVISVAPHVQRVVDHAIERRARDLLVAIAARDPFEVRGEWMTRRRLRAAIRDELPSSDVAVIEHSQLAPLAPAVRPRATVVTLHNLLSVRARHQRALARSRRERWLWTRELRRACAFERRVIASADAVVVMSVDDARHLPAGAVVVTNGVDLTHFEPVPLGAEPVIVVTASLHYPPNIDGVLWFHRDVFPLVLERVPEARLAVVGRSMTPEIVALGDHESVELHPDVPDVVPYLHRARVAIVPIRVGSGTRLKALEAMACGRPVVGTTIGLEGLGVRHGVDAIVADDPESFAGSVVSMLVDDHRAEEIGQSGREVASGHRWEVSTARFVELVSELSSS